MPHQYGLPGFAQSPPSPPSQHVALMPRIGGGAVVPANSTNNSIVNSNANQIYRPQIQDTRLTRDAMERYLRDRNDMVIVILHAKVSQNEQQTKFVIIFVVKTNKTKKSLKN